MCGEEQSRCISFSFPQKNTDIPKRAERKKKMANAEAKPYKIKLIIWWLLLHSFQLYARLHFPSEREPLNLLNPIHTTSRTRTGDRVFSNWKNKNIYPFSHESHQHVIRKRRRWRWRIQMGRKSLSFKLIQAWKKKEFGVGVKGCMGVY